MKWFAPIALAACCVVRGALVNAQTAHVAEVIGARADAYEVASIGDRTWVATSGGVVVMRGDRVVRTLTVRDGLMGMRARSLSRVGTDVWVGGVDGATRFESVDGDAPRAAETIAIPRVQRVASLEGTLFVATAGHGLLRRANGETRFTSVQIGRTPAFMHVSDLLADGASLWISTAGAGVLRLDARGRVVDRIGARAGLPSDLAWQMVRDGERLLVATSAGIAVIRGHRVDRAARETAATATLRIPDVRSIARDNASLYASTFGAGVVRFDNAHARFVAIADAPDNTRALAVDGNGIVVTSRDGAVRFDSRGARSTLLEGGLPSSDITALTEAFGALWIGTFDRGLARRNPDGSIDAMRIALDRWHIDPRVNDLARTQDAAHAERLWIATDRGLFVHDGRSFVPVIESHAPAREHITALHVDAHGTLWVAGSDGLFALDPARDTWTHVDGPDAEWMHPLGAVTTDANGTVWAGGLHGLFEIDPHAARITRHAVATGELPVDWITAIAPVANGIVAGTYHGGIVWFGAAHASVEREGASLPSGWVNPHALAVVDGTVWFGALDRGLVVGTAGHWRALTIASGLPGNDVTAIASAGGDALWIGTRAGLARVERH